MGQAQPEVRTEAQLKELWEFAELWGELRFLVTQHPQPRQFLRDVVEAVGDELAASGVAVSQSLSLVEALRRVSFQQPLRPVR